MRRWLSTTLGVGVLIGVTTSASAQQVNLTLDDGFVTLTTKDATVRQIRAEWSRVGHTKIVNAERVTGTPVTLQLVKVPEAEALDILLRSVSGYMAAPRADGLTNGSRFDRILVMPSSTPPRVAATSPAPAPSQSFQAPAALPEEFENEDPFNGATPNAPTRGPVFPQFPGGPQAAQPGQRGPVLPAPQPGAGMPAGQFPQPSPFPQATPPVQGFTPPPSTPGGMPMGVSTPGMMVAPPQPMPAGSPNEPPQ